jgi:peptidyl-prolyl cis-trans isomerase C
MRLNRLAAAMLAATLSLPVLAAPVATVNGSAIDKSEVDNAVAMLMKNSNGQVKDSPSLREEVKNRLINRELILQEAKRRGLDKSPEVQKRLDEVRNDLVQEALFADILKKDPVDDAKVKAAYDKIAGNIKGSKEVHARQIVLGSEDDAKKAIADLKKGGNFEALAKARSKDPVAKQSGGDMGYMNLSALERDVPPLAAALKSLPKGGVSPAPVKSNAGWHVFKVEDIRDAKVPPFDQVKGQLKRDLQEQEIGKTVDGLRSSAKIQ